MKPRRKSPMRVLALDPGSREIGVAVLDGEKLCYHDVLVIGRHKSRAAALFEIRSRIDRLFLDLRPDLLAIAKTFVGRNRRAAILNVIYDDIVDLVKQRRIRVVSASPLTCRKYVTGYGWSPKEKVAEAIVANWFRELRPYFGMRRASQAAFHFNRFDAIAVGLWAVTSRAGVHQAANLGRVPV